MWSGKINMLLFYVSCNLWFVTSLLHYFSHVPSADTCNIIVFYQSRVTNNTVIMFSTVRNNAYSEHVMEIMTQGLRKVCKSLVGKLLSYFLYLCCFRALSVMWSLMFPQARRSLNVTNLYSPGPGKMSRPSMSVCLQFS